MHGIIIIVNICPQKCLALKPGSYGSLSLCFVEGRWEPPLAAGQPAFPSFDLCRERVLVQYDRAKERKQRKCGEKFKVLNRRSPFQL
jgi:hypothetical protein